MRHIAVTPRICYEGEGTFPARNRLVIVYRIHREGGGVADAWLAHTGDDGRLHPLFDDYQSPSFNKVTCVKHTGFGEFFTVENFKRPYDAKKEPLCLYKHPMKFRSGELVGMVFVPAKTPPQSIPLAALRKEGLVRKGYIAGPQVSAPSKSGATRRLASLRRVKGARHYWLALPCDYASYLARLRGQVQRLNALLKKYQDRLGNLLYCSALIDQLAQHLEAQRRARYQTWFMKFSNKPNTTRVKLAQRSGMESELLRTELIVPMQKNVELDIKRIRKVFQNRIDRCGEELNRILVSRPHNEAFERRFAKELEEHEEIDGHVRRTYEHAYVLASRTSSGRKLYHGHVKPLLDLARKNKDKSKQQAREALLELDESVGWAKKFTEGVVECVYAYADSKLSTGLARLQRDLLGAMYFLQCKGLATNVSGLAERLEHPGTRAQQVDVDDYIVKTKKTEAVRKVLRALMSALKAGVTLNEKKLVIREKLGGSNEVAGCLVDLGKSEAMKGMWSERELTLRNSAATVASVLDWGFSLDTLYQTARKTGGLDMAIATVTYAGKSFVMVGQTLSLAGMIGPGAALLGLGKAINLAATIGGTALRWIRDYEGPQMNGYSTTLKALEKADKHDRYHDSYRNAKRQRANDTDFHLQKVFINEDAARAAGQQWCTGLISRKYMKLEEMIQKKYFYAKEWGLVAEWSSL